MIIDSSFQLTGPALISFEGGNAVGKSTLMRGIGEYLRQKGCKVVETREPGGTSLGVQIRRMVKESTDFAVDPLAELFLFAADRAQHVQTVIKPALDNGSYVLTDRYYHSTLAFQGAGRKLDEQVVKSSIEYAIGGVRPQLVVLIDLPIEESMRRVQARQAEETDRFEQEDINFQQQIRNSFLNLAETTPEPWLVLDGTLPRKALLEKAIKVFS